MSCGLPAPASCITIVSQAHDRLEFQVPRLAVGCHGLNSGITTLLVALVTFNKTYCATANPKLHTITATSGFVPPAALPPQRSALEELSLDP